MTYFILANLLTPPLSPSKNKNSSAIEHAQTKKTKVDEFKSEEAAEEDDEDEDGPEDNDEFFPSNISTRCHLVYFCKLPIFKIRQTINNVGI